MAYLGWGWKNSLPRDSQWDDKPRPLWMWGRIRATLSVRAYPDHSGGAVAYQEPDWSPSRLRRPVWRTSTAVWTRWSTPFCRRTFARASENCYWWAVGGVAVRRVQAGVPVVPDRETAGRTTGAADHQTACSERTLLYRWRRSACWPQVTNSVA